MQGEQPSTAAAAAAAQTRPPAAAAGPAAPTLLGIAQQLFDDLRAALQARAHLLALEAQRAGLALVLMALYGMVAALLLVTAWFCLWTLLVVLAVSLGAPLWLALLVVLAASLLVAWLLLSLVRTEARHLLFPASVRQLAPMAGAEAAAKAHAPAGAE